MKLLVRPLAVVLITASLVVACSKKRASPASTAEPSAPRVERKPISKSLAPAESPALAPGLLSDDGAYEAWFKKYHLDLNDPKMLDADPDGDGATNREEFMADTDPRDPNSRPGVHKVMRLAEYNEVRVPLVLESVEGQSAKIRHTDEAGAGVGAEPKTETVSVGQTIGGLKVSKITSRHVTDKDGKSADLSRVDLADLANNDKVVLIKDMTSKSSATFALLSSADGTEKKVHQGEVFQWPSEHGGTYKVIDLRPDQAVVQDMATSQIWTIPQK